MFFAAAAVRGSLGWPLAMPASCPVTTAYGDASCVHSDGKAAALTCRVVLLACICAGGAADAAVAQISPQLACVAGVALRAVGGSSWAVGSRQLAGQQTAACTQACAVLRWYRHRH